MKVLVVSVVLLLVAQAQASQNNVVSEEPRMFCGRHLFHALTEVCTMYNNGPRSALYGMGSRSQNAEWPWMANRAKAIAMDRDKDASLVETCCLRPCYVWELFNFC